MRIPRTREAKNVPKASSLAGGRAGIQIRQADS